MCASQTCTHTLEAKCAQTLTYWLKSNSNVMMGSEEDPKDGAAVAGAVFGAVFIYIVRRILPYFISVFTNKL